MKTFKTLFFGWGGCTATLGILGTGGGSVVRGGVSHPRTLDALVGGLGCSGDDRPVTGATPPPCEGRSDRWFRREVRIFAPTAQEGTGPNRYYWYGRGRRRGSGGALAQTVALHAISPSFSGGEGVLLHSASLGRREGKLRQRCRMWPPRTKNILFA